MSYLKEESLEKCFTLLGEFIDEAQALSNHKGVATLALKQLERITAGTLLKGAPAEVGGEVGINSFCTGRPRADAGL
ncbi:MAG: hypothetical protein GY757_27560 [bacterium]|nr:hypothetical protein [bacterium]